jgi:hypothetical protein
MRITAEITRERRNYASKRANINHKNMTDFKNIDGIKILDAYIKLYEKSGYSKSDYEHFSKTMQSWWEGVFKALERRGAVELSLSKTNYLGKKTRALLDVMQLKEPKTLGVLLGILWNEVPERFHEVEPTNIL